MVFFSIWYCRKSPGETHVFLVPPDYEGILELCDCDEFQKLANEDSRDSIIYDLRVRTNFCAELLYNISPPPTQNMHFYSVTDDNDLIPLTTTYLGWESLASKANGDRFYVALYYSRRDPECVKMFIGKGKNIENLVVSSLGQ